jgi:DNA-binding NarL/FixJ family response regulator
MRMDSRLSSTALSRHPTLIHVVVVAQVPLFGDGLARYLDQYEFLDVTTASGETWQGPPAPRMDEPIIVLLDVTLRESPLMLETIVSTAQDVKVVALAIPDSDDEVMALAEAGISGYVTRNATLPELVSIIRSVASGEMPCSPRVSASLLRRVSMLAKERPRRRRPFSLTRRELEVLELMGEGLSNSEIGRRLWIQVPTVKNHVHSILEKLKVSNRQQAFQQFKTR